MIEIERNNQHEYRVVNLPECESIWIKVESFDVQITRVDGGVRVALFDYDDPLREQAVASCTAWERP